MTQFAPRGPAVTECPRTPETRGAIFEYFWRSRDELLWQLCRGRPAAVTGRQRPGGVRDRPHASRRSRAVVRQHDQRRPAQDSDGRLLTGARRADASRHQRRRLEPDHHPRAAGATPEPNAVCRGTTSCDRSSPKSCRPATRSSPSPPTSRTQHPLFAIGDGPLTVHGASRPPAAKVVVERTEHARSQNSRDWSSSLRSLSRFILDSSRLELTRRSARRTPQACRPHRRRRR